MLCQGFTTNGSGVLYQFTFKEEVVKDIMPEKIKVFDCLISNFHFCINKSLIFVALNNRQVLIFDDLNNESLKKVDLEQDVCTEILTIQNGSLAIMVL